MSKPVQVWPPQLNDGVRDATSDASGFAPPPEETQVPTDFTSKDYIDRSMDAVRAQNDARFAEVMSALDKKPSTWTLIATVFGAAATILGVILAVLAFGGDRFDGGIAASSMLRDAQEAQAARDAAQDSKLDAILDRLDAIVPSDGAPPP